MRCEKVNFLFGIDRHQSRSTAGMSWGARQVVLWTTGPLDIRNLSSNLFRVLLRG